MSQQSQRSVQRFASRFEPDGSDYLYRKNLREAPIRVTAAERDAFIADFAGAMSSAHWFVVVGTVAVIVVSVFLVIKIPGLNAPYVLFALMALLFIIYLLIYNEAANAPSVALRSRAVAGTGRSQEEARAIMLSKVSWRGLGLAALAGAFGLFRLSLHMDLTAGWNRLWLAGAAVLYGLLAYRAYQKLRHGSAELPSEQ